jgi:hypothetical protein
LASNPNFNNFSPFFTIFSALHDFSLKSCSKLHNKIDLLHLIVALQLSGGWQLNYSTKTRQVHHANKHPIYHLMPIADILPKTVAS